jgi:hypothetical protein
LDLSSIPRRANRTLIPAGGAGLDQDLDLLPGVGSSVQHYPGQELGEFHTGQPQCHRRDHAGLRLVAKHQVTGYELSFGHPQAETTEKPGLADGLPTDALKDAGQRLLGLLVQREPPPARPR